jgi:hypothetical protein
MGKIIIIIRAIFVSSTTARATIFLVAFFLLVSSAKSQPIALGSKPDSHFYRINLPEWAVLMNQKLLNSIL